jgi:hypothetical protein
MSTPPDPSIFAPRPLADVLAIPAARIAAIEALTGEDAQFVILDFVSPLGRFRLRFDRLQIDRLLEYLPLTVRELDRFQKGYNADPQVN